MNRESRLKDQGFEEPFEYDREPFEAPGLWEYRGLMNSGGHVYARVWRHKQKNLEVWYNMLSNNVAVIGGKYHPEKEEYVGDFEDVIDERKASDGFDETDKRELARELMEENP